MKKTKKTDLVSIKKKYFIKNPELSTDQIQNLLSITKDYLTSVNLNYEPEIKQSILQSSISLILVNQQPIENEKKL